MDEKRVIIEECGEYFKTLWNERIKQPPETATQLICVRENRKPDIFGRS